MKVLWKKILSYKVSSNDIGKRIDQYLAQNEKEYQQDEVKKSYP